MLPAFWPLRYRLRETRSAVASWTGSHSRTTEVWVALRQRRTGVAGSESPKELKMRSCRARNLVSSVLSLVEFWATLMSTMLPEEMLGGRRMEGNSIWMTRRLAGRMELWRGTLVRVLYQALIRRQEDRDARVDLADGEGDEHRGGCLVPAGG